jgi:hypothetical protein
MVWSSDDGVTVEQINEERHQIMVHEVQQQEATHDPDGTPNCQVG